MPATLLFDLDGTLVDTAPDLWGALNIVLEGNGYRSVAYDRVGNLVGQGALAMIERGLAENGASPSRDAIKAMHARFLDHYRARVAKESRPFPGVDAALERLSNRGHVLAVCTNKYEALSTTLLTELGLASRFAAICGPDTFGVKKPDPDHVWLTIDRVGGRRDNAVMIGDSATDINAARAAGIPVIAVPFGYSDTPVTDLSPDCVIEHYYEIDTALARLAQAGRPGISDPADR